MGSKLTRSFREATSAPPSPSPNYIPRVYLYVYLLNGFLPGNVAHATGRSFSCALFYLEGSGQSPPMVLRLVAEHHHRSAYNSVPVRRSQPSCAFRFIQLLYACIHLRRNRSSQESLRQTKKDFFWAGGGRERGRDEDVGVDMAIAEGHLASTTCGKSYGLTVVSNRRSMRELSPPLYLCLGGLFCIGRCRFC